MSVRCATLIHLAFRPFPTQALTLPSKQDRSSSSRWILGLFTRLSALREKCVNTAIFSPSGGSVGIGFDIPAATAKSVIEQLKNNGHVTRGWLGVQIQPVTSEVADAMGLKQVSGALVDEPQANGPAAKAGIKAGDVIV